MRTPSTFPLDPTLMATFVGEPSMARRMQGEVVGSRLHFVFIFVFFCFFLRSVSVQLILLISSHFTPQKKPLHNPSLICELRHFYITADVLYLSCHISSKKLPSKNKFLPRDQTSRQTLRVFKKLKKRTFTSTIF